MATGYHRLSRKARHLIRQLRRTKNAALQRLHLHELRHAISRRHGFGGPGKMPDLGKAGRFRPLTRRAKQLLTRLRRSRVWSIQKQLVNELVREIEKGRYLRERVARSRPARAARRARQKGREFRRGVQRAQERHLARAERRQGERERGTRKPPLAARARRKGREVLGGTRDRIRSWRSRRAGQARPQRSPRPAPPRPVRVPRPSPVRPRARFRAARPAPVRARTR
jgi:hypothetical protein